MTNNGAVTLFELLRMAEVALGGSPEEFTAARREDGSPADLLWERFRVGSLEELGPVPAQPEG